MGPLLEGNGKKCEEQLLCVFLGQFGRREIEVCSKMSSALSKV